MSWLLWIMLQRPWGAHSTSRGVAVTWRPRLQVPGLRPVSFRSGRTCSGRTRGAQAPEQHPLARSCVSAFSVPRRAFDCIPARPENFGDLADALTFVRVRVRDRHNGKPDLRAGREAVFSARDVFVQVPLSPLSGSLSSCASPPPYLRSVSPISRRGPVCTQKCALSAPLCWLRSAGSAVLAPLCWLRFRLSALGSLQRPSGSRRSIC